MIKGKQPMPSELVYKVLSEIQSKKLKAILKRLDESDKPKEIKGELTDKQANDIAKVLSK